MFRNIVLGVSSLGVLVLLFVAYNHYIGAVDDGRAAEAVAQLPPETSSSTQPLRVAGAMDVPPGGKIIFTKYDERSGRATDMFMCQDWQTVPGTKNQIRVRGPELAVALPSGMIAHISAAEGEVAVDRIEEKDMRPQEGWLAGDVRIELDRETRPDRTPRAERPEDLLTVATDRLQFNLGSGELHTDSRLTVTSADFEVAGTGLHLVWNQGDNRVDRLTIERGEQFVLYAAADLLGMRTSTDAETGPVAASAPVASAPSRRARRSNSYRCTLAGGVTAEQFQGAERIGGLTADQVELLFDLGGSTRMSNRPTPTTAPQSAPAERNRLVVRWNGPLELHPVAPPEDPADRRRRLSAVGNPVVMTRREGAVRCGRVDFQEETQRVWLHPTATGTVDFGLGEKLSATAESIFIDRGARIVKLIGDVELRSLKSASSTAPSTPVHPASRASSIRCAYWAELHLADDTPASAPADLPGEVAGGDPLASGQLESATFVGEVEVRLGQPMLTAHRLDVTFQPGGEGRGLEELLDRAWANGDVQLTSGEGRISAANLEFTFDLSPSGALFPQQMQAVGAVQISSGKATVTGSRVLAQLVPPPDDEPGASARFYIRELHVLGQAELIDPVEKRAARGDELIATFGSQNRLETASVIGSAAEWALVHARPYTVRGERIELNATDWTLHVDGPSRLALKTQRSLQGSARRRPVPIVVTSQDALRIDGRGNRVRFAGDVIARSQGEQVRGDVLTLVMEDKTSPDAAPDADEPGFRELWRQARRLLANSGARSTDRLFAVAADAEPAGADKEPRRVLVENALVTSEALEENSAQPLMHASISAPQLEIDIPNRQIVTSGTTELLLTDRRSTSDPEAARVALGVPSALVSKGPHQTAMRCTGRMVYTLGPDGPDRRDTVVFEDQVVFVHRTGRDMVNFEQMLPAGADAAAASALRSRNAALDCERLECWFAADERDPALEGGGGLTRTPLRLTSLIASGSVYLRDVEDRQVREVNAAWVEFDAEASRIRVRGSDATEARVYFEDQDGQVRVTPGRQIEVNLQDGTIRSDRIQGEFRRG